MKNLKKMLFMLMICLLTFAMPLSASAAVKINKKQVVLINGQTTKLKVTGTSKKVKWSTNKKKIVTVTQKGQVEALKKGKAVITAKVGNKKLTCKVTVESPEISATEVELNVKEKTQLKMSGTQQRVTWKSSMPGVAAVTAKGRITAKKAGTAVITATVNKKKYVCNVTVVKNVETQETETDNVQHGTGTYALNTNTMKFHYLTCGSAKRISAANYAESNESRYALIEQGYDPCGNCHP